MLKISGEVLAGVYAAGESIGLLAHHAGAEVRSYRPDEWYDSRELHTLVEQLKRYSNPAEFLVRIGETMIGAWYEHGPGKIRAPTGIDFLRFQSGSNGYLSVVRGPADEVGNFSLLDLDERRGLATIRSTTIFDKHLELGILRGGLAAADDVLFGEVRMSEEPGTFNIRIVNAANVATVPWAATSDTEKWQLRNEIVRLRSRERYWECINETLNSAFAQLRDEATVDALTGLVTRRELLRRIELEQARARRYRKTLALIYCDLNNFKLINDRFGHAAGDRVLQSVGNTLRGLFRSPDCVGRIGGDEFLILLCDSNEEQAQRAVSRLQAAVRGLEIDHPTHKLKVSLSMGVATLEGRQSIDSAVGRADRNMYEQKQAARVTDLPTIGARQA